MSKRIFYLKIFVIALFFGLILDFLFFANFFFKKEVLASGGGGGPDVINVETQGLRPNSCCRLKHQVQSGGSSYLEGNYVGPPVPSDASDLKEMLCPEEENYKETSLWAGLCTLDAVMTVSDWVVWITEMLVVIMVVIAGILFMTAMGNTDQINKAKSLLKWIIVGLALAVGAKIIPGVVKFFLGV